MIRLPTDAQIFEASEGINSQVARIIANARGLACFENLRIRVLSFLGKLDLSPA
jgi:hypothetical protein